jgi:excisionase family DNA binding protein
MTVQQNETDRTGLRGSRHGEQFVSRIRAAELLDCSPQTIDKLIRQGAIKAFRVGRKVIVRRADLLRLVEASEIGW